MTTLFRDTIQFELVSIAGHAQSCLGQAMAQGYTVQYLGASANRTVNALEGTPATTAANLAALTYDLIMKGIIDAA
jgi:hypothetical protein